MSDDFFGDHTYPTARKAHKCCTCYRTIDSGETYSRQFCVFDGRAYAWKQCVHCEKLLPYIDYDYTYSDEDYVEWEPRTVEELRVRVHFNKRWRNNAGELYPIPFQAVA